MNGGRIICISKPQSCTAESTAEAEFNSLAHAIREVKWICIVLTELQLIDENPITIPQDNLESIFWM